MDILLKKEKKEMGRKSKLSPAEQASLYKDAITTKISYRELGKNMEFPTKLLGT